VCCVISYLGSASFPKCWTEWKLVSIFKSIVSFPPTSSVPGTRVYCVSQTVGCTPTRLAPPEDKPARVLSRPKKRALAENCR
jgi:hypothetical protein